MNPMQHPERPLTPPEPCEVQPNASDLKQAREELAEQVSAGKKVGRIDLEAALDAEMNADERVFLADLTVLFGSIGMRPHTMQSYYCDSLAYIERIAAKHIADEDVREYAIDKMNERDE